MRVTGWVAAGCFALAAVRIITIPEVRDSLSNVWPRATPAAATPNVLTLPPVKLGKRLHFPEAVRPRGTGNALLVVCGDCASCTVSLLQPTKIQTASYSQVILVFATDAPSIPKRFKTIAPNVVVLADPDGRVVRQLDLAPDPRFYLLSNDLTLLDAQRTIAETPAFVRRSA